MQKQLCWARFDFVRIKIVTAVHARLWLWFRYKFYKHRNRFSPQGSSLLTTHFVQPAKETKMKTQNQWFCFAPMILHSSFKEMTSGTDWLHWTATSPSSRMLRALPLWQQASDGTWQFSNRYVISKRAKVLVVHRNGSDNHCNRSYTAIHATTTALLANTLLPTLSSAHTRTHAHTHTHTHACAHTHTRTHTVTCTRTLHITHTYTHTHTHTQWHTRAHCTSHTHSDIHTHTARHIHTEWHMHAHCMSHTDTHTLTHTHTLTQTHTHSSAFLGVFLLCFSEPVTLNNSQYVWLVANFFSVFLLILSGKIPETTSWCEPWQAPSLCTQTTPRNKIREATNSLV